MYYSSTLMSATKHGRLDSLEKLGYPVSETRWSGFGDDLKWSNGVHYVVALIKTIGSNRICGTSNLDNEWESYDNRKILPRRRQQKHVVPCYLCNDLDMNVQTSKWCAILHETKLSWRFYPEDRIRHVRSVIWQFMNVLSYLNYYNSTLIAHWP